MLLINGSNRVPIEIVRGDSELFQVGISVNGEDYTPVTGDVIRFAMKRKESRYPLIEKEIPHDTMQLHIDPDDTNGLPFGTYVYDMQITFADGTVKTFVRQSPFIIGEEV